MSVLKASHHHKLSNGLPDSSGTNANDTMLPMQYSSPPLAWSIEKQCYCELEWQKHIHCFEHIPCCCQDMYQECQSLLHIKHHWRGCLHPGLQLCLQFVAAACHVVVQIVDHIHLQLQAPAIKPPKKKPPHQYPSFVNSPTLDFKVLWSSRIIHFDSWEETKEEYTPGLGSCSNHSRTAGEKHSLWWRDPRSSNPFSPTVILLNNHHGDLETFPVTLNSASFFILLNTIATHDGSEEEEAKTLLAKCRDQKRNFRSNKGHSFRPSFRPSSVSDGSHRAWFRFQILRKNGNK